MAKGMKWLDALVPVEWANENGGKDNIAVVLVQPDTKEVQVC